MCISIYLSSIYYSVFYFFIYVATGIEIAINTEDMEDDVFKILCEDPDRGLRLIVKRHGDQILSQISRFVEDEDMAKEVFQLTLIQIWAQRDVFGLKHDAFGWIMGIARNQALKIIRNERRGLKDDIENFEDLSNNEQADSEIIYKETLRLIIDAKELTPKEREIVKAVDVIGMDNKEVKKVFNIKSQTLRNTLSKARSKLRKLLKR